MTRTLVVTMALATVLASVGTSWAQDETRPAAETIGPASPATEMIVKASVVNVRSGPGLYFYEVVKLSQGARVTALDEARGWTAIAPPSNVVALISKSNVSSSDGAAGKVPVSKARVYARDPNSGRTWAVIAELPVDSDVTITGQEGSYYTIAVPAGAKVWIKSEYLSSPTDGSGDDAGTTTPRIDITNIELRPIKIDPQAEAYDEAIALLDAEMAKPLVERKWDDAEAALKAVGQEATSPHLKAGIERTLATIEFQKSLQASLAKLDADKKALQANLAAIRSEAEQRQAARLEEARRRVTTNFGIEGTLRKMHATMAYKYRLEDDQGKFVYLLSGEAAMLDPLLGRQVRVWGDKQYRPELKKYVCDVQRIEAVGDEDQ